MSIEELPDILDARTISKFLGISYAKTLSIIQYSGMPYVKLGQTYRVLKSKFIEFLSEDKAKIII